MTAERWERLRATLVEAGFDAVITERPYSEADRGRVRHGVSRSITLRTPDGLVVVSDKWWRKNTDVWIGWQVYQEDHEGIVTRQWPLTKKRSEVSAAVASILPLARTG